VHLGSASNDSDVLVDDLFVSRLVCRGGRLKSRQAHYAGTFAAGLRLLAQLADLVAGRL